MQLTNEKWALEIKSLGGEIYFVGGCVRDFFLNKKSKDIDLLVRKVESENLIVLLKKYGRVDLVGESFGIIKFKPFDSNEDFDIALPRTEKWTGEKGYRAFNTISDPFLDIEKDLERRDFTINSIAKNAFTGEFVDPFGGIKDINNRVIKMTNPETFKDDPLRMLRAIQFASRFNFLIDIETERSIIANGERIKEIPFERVLIELDKIVKKGSISLAYYLLDTTNLGYHIFGVEIKSSPYNYDVFNNSDSIGSFLFFLLKNKLSGTVSEFMKSKICSNDDVKICKALEFAYSTQKPTYMDAFKLYALSSDVFFSKQLPLDMMKVVDYIIINKMPYSFKELKINGDDLISEFGFEGKQIKEKLIFVIESIYNKKVENNKNKIIKFLTNE